jgi:hypothetical protein
MDPGEAPRRVRARAIIAALAFLPFIAYACTNQAISNIFSLMAAPVGALILMLLLNFPLRRYFPNAALSSTDLLVFYGLVAVGGAMSTEWVNIGHGAMHAFPLQGPSNPLIKDTMMPNMPDWLSIKDANVVQDMTSGSRDVGYVVSKLPLLSPKYLGWGMIFMLVVGGMLCLNSLMRKAWTQTERLTFPLIQLPVAMVETGAGSMWRSRRMWIAFGIMFSIDILNGLNYLYPNLPSIPTKEIVNLELLFKEPPMSNIGHFKIAIFPFLAAIGLFVPSDLLFSLVFFFLMRKAVNVIMAANGVPQGWFSGTGISPGAPYWDEQTWGAVLAIFFGAVWISRGHLKEVWRDIRTGVKDSDGGVPHRWAFLGLMACLAGLTALGVEAQLPLPYAVLYFSLIFIFGVVITRIRAQLGPPLHEFAFFGPNSLMFRAFGTDWLSDKSAVFLSQTMVTFNRIHRTHPMPLQLEAMKMTRDKRIHQGQMFGWILVVSVISLLLAYFCLHVLVYRTGDANRWPEGEGYLRNLMNNKRGVDWRGLGMTAFGASVVLLLDTLRFRIPGFPLHPAGYVLSMNFGIDYCWFGLLLALVVKNFVTRYYGLAGYDRLRHVAFGILLGEYAAELLWMSIAMLTGHSTYTISLNDRGIGTQ